MLCNNFKAKRLQKRSNCKINIKIQQQQPQQERAGGKKNLNEATNASLLLFANGKCLLVHAVVRDSLNWSEMHTYINEYYVKMLG